MHFSMATLVLGLAAFASGLPQDATLAARQNQNRPVPSGSCCVANTNLKQDTCTASNGQAGRCVPGGNNCGSRLSCVAQSSLTCDNSVIERGKSLCRANAPGGGLFDGANIIQSLAQAKVN
ncbi:hypothetical protein N657DRAFT_582964 [Parathielavia appendiculata]|uniref:Uncharacterized protein n=1 Tax=Parathielavia appendiculata TaxID=2587402 RepID=A0AAN6YZ03_9PEZI|nr:hypothetical protein N657DRAFT_582964 [Parathielavia appendiculata]